MTWTKEKTRAFVFTVVAIIVLYLIGAAVICAQDYRLSVQGVYAPQDNGIGIKAGCRLHKMGFYSSFSHGNYFGLDCYNQPFYIKDHTRYGAGLLRYSGNAYLSAGLVFHSFGVMDNVEFLNPRAFEPVSAEFGAGCLVNRLACGFRFDPFKWTGRIDIGINMFKTRRKL